MRIQNKLSVFRNPASRYTELYIYQLLPDNKISHVESLNLNEVTDGEQVIPTLLMNDESLWDQGYRPKNYQDESALKYHLEDMRKIAFKFLDLQ